MSRVACGIIAGIVGILAGVVATVIEMRVLGVSRPRTFWIVFFACGRCHLRFRRPAWNCVAAVYATSDGSSRLGRAAAERHGADLNESMPLNPGTRLGPYESAATIRC
jgi:hypothetical protein